MTDALEMICAKCRSNEWGPETPRKEILAWFHDFAAAAIEQAEKQEPTPAMIQALTEQYDADQTIGIGFNPQTLCRAVLAVQRQPLTKAQRQQRDGINSPNRGSLGGAHD